jgi:site-specific DNA-adenine methylase
MKTKSALSYFGSDSEVAPQLAALLDHCKHITIPFVGGASILPHLTARAIVCNDLHAAAITFYKVASGVWGDRDDLIRQCQHTLSHPQELEDAGEVLRNKPGYTSTDKAWAFWAACWLGRKGKGGTRHMGGMPSVRRTANGGTNASRVRAAANDLEAWAKEFERCEWEQVCFRELLPKVADQPDCGVYCDPPWPGAGRDYLHTFTEQDHRDLAALLSRFEHSTVVVRYGDDPLLRSLYRIEEGWHWIDASSRTQANKVRGEVWITNRKPKIV